MSDFVLVVLLVGVGLFLPYLSIWGLNFRLMELSDRLDAIESRRASSE